MGVLPRRSGLLAALVAMAVAVFTAPVAAHVGGTFELWVASARFTAEPGGGVLVSVDLVDRDSGTEGVGFAAVAEATRSDDVGDPVRARLGETSTGGTYEGVLDLDDGDWTVVITADQGESALPALKSDRSFDIEVADGRVERAGGGGSSAALIIVPLALVSVAAVGAVVVFSRRRSAVERQVP